MRPQFDVLALGGVAVDELVYTDGFPGPDEKTAILVHERRCGGISATALIAASRLGCKCAYAGVLGTDEGSAFAIDQMRRAGIDVRHVDRRDRVEPIRSIIIIDTKTGARKTFFDESGAPGAARDWPPEAVIRSARVLFVDWFSVPGMIRAARCAREAGLPVVGDFGRAGLRGLATLLPLVDHLIVSQTFAADLTGVSDPRRAAQKLWNGRQKLAAVTCGADGCFYVADEAPSKVLHQPAFKVKAVDTSGCGDVFHGAYAAALARGMSAPERIRFASAAAALKASGPIPSLKRTVGMMLVLFVMLLGPLAARAQDQPVTLPDLLEGAQQWAKENLDSNVVNALPKLDDRSVQQFYAEIQKRFQGDYVVDLAGLRQSAQAVQTWLDSSDATKPYAAWLASQMDYFDVADEIRLSIPPLKMETNQPPLVPRPPNPPPQAEREIWIKKVAARPWPAPAKEYVPELKPIFAAQKIPPELVWVAEVESSFDRRAESPAGAAGLFQLMPDTAKRFGLSLWPRDQRFQPEPSATASAQYFKFLHDRFHDWRLALAAYNSGEGTVQKLLTRYKTRRYDDIAGHLPAETQMYVPRVEAVILRREGTKLEQLTAPGT